MNTTKTSQAIEDAIKALGQNFPEEFKTIALAPRRLDWMPLRRAPFGEQLVDWPRFSKWLLTYRKGGK